MSSGKGVHIHVVRGPRRLGCGRQARGFGKDDWLLAHCVHLDRPLRGTIAHNPRSNMNNAVGYARPARLANTVVLGTDGIGADMLEEFRIAYVRHREDDVTATPQPPGHGSKTASRSFPRRPIRPGPVELRARSTPGTSPLRPACGRSKSSVDGEVVLKEGRPTRVDPTRGAGARAGATPLGQVVS